MQMVMTTDETQIQIFADESMSHAKRMTWDNRKNPEYHWIWVSASGLEKTINGNVQYYFQVEFNFWKDW